MPLPEHRPLQRAPASKPEAETKPGFHRAQRATLEVMAAVSQIKKCACCTYLLHVVPVVLLVAWRQVVWSAAVLAAAAADAVPGHELRPRRMPFPDAVRAQARDAQQALRLHPNAVAPCIEPTQQVHVPFLQHRHIAGCALTTLHINESWYAEHVLP